MTPNSLPIASRPKAEQSKAQTRKVLLKRREIAHQTEPLGPLPAMCDWLSARLRRDYILATYNPTRTERDPSPLHAAMAADLAFPRVMGPNQPLAFFLARSEADFEIGSFGVLEPKKNLPQVFPDLILVPLVGFDHAGYRLGYGGGFYDRTLAQIRAKKTVLAVGFAYDGQRSSQPLNFEPTDLALDAIITPTCCYEFQSPTAKVTPWS